MLKICFQFCLLAGLKGFFLFIVRVDLVVNFLESTSTPRFISSIFCEMRPLFVCVEGAKCSKLEASFWLLLLFEDFPSIGLYFSNLIMLHLRIEWLQTLKIVNWICSRSWEETSLTKVPKSRIFIFLRFKEKFLHSIFEHWIQTNLFSRKRYR